MGSKRQNDPQFLPKCIFIARAEKPTEEYLTNMKENSSRNSLIILYTTGFDFHKVLWINYGTKNKIP